MKNGADGGWLDRIVTAMGVLVIVLALWVFLKPTKHTARPVVELGPVFAPFDSLARIATNLTGGPARDTLLVFTDLQCPFCAEFAAAIDSINHSGAGTSLALLILHMPIERIHPLARTLAQYVECAGREGAAKAAHDAIFAARSRILAGDTVVLRTIRNQFLRGNTACVSSASVAARIDRHLAIARTLNIAGTPTVFLNGHWLEGTPGVAGLTRLLASQSDDRGRSH